MTDLTKIKNADLMSMIAELVNDEETFEEIRKSRPNKAAMIEILESLKGASSGRRMAEILGRYRVGYLPTVSASGRKSLNNGDALADHLAGMTPEQVMDLAEKVLELDPGFLHAKYDRLNAGQRRMNAGNRIRAAIKRGDILVDDVMSVKI